MHGAGVRRMLVSIVVPVLNELEVLQEMAESLTLLLREGVEVVVVDGGSTDGSVALARAAGLRVLEATRGRARQLNTGAAATRGDVLLFLHADTKLPEHAVRLVLHALKAGERVWGRFDVQIEGRSPMLRIVAWLMNARSRLTGIATGDQAIFVARRAFESVGGFPDQPLMEDIELSRRLRRVSRPICLAERVTTSGRRWERNGVWRTIWLMWRLRLSYWLGASPSELAARYR